MKRKIPRIAALCAALGMAVAAIAQTASNFSGTWTLNTSKGKNLGMVAAIQETATIAQTKDKLTLDFASTFQGKTTNRQVNYDLTGKPMANESAMGEKAETVAKWDGGKLVVTWTSEGAIAGTKVVKTDTHALSADGRTMTVTTQRGDNPAREMVYEKK